LSFPLPVSEEAEEEEDVEALLVGAGADACGSCAARSGAARDAGWFRACDAEFGSGDALAPQPTNNHSAPTNPVELNRVICRFEERPPSNRV
jgi:hypothetical protein